VQQAAMLHLGGDASWAGAGGGLGAQLVWRGRFVAQADANLLWATGNAVTTRLAAGVQRRARWSPAAWATLTLVWGDRIEKLDDDGSRPPRPGSAVGLRGSPLRWATPQVMVSAGELGVAFTPSGGLWLEMTVLAVGATF
jgi:hypothetical protein